MYTKLFNDSVDVIYPIPNRIIELEILQSDTHEISSVKIIYNKNVKSKELLAMNELGEALCTYADNTSRVRTKEKGKLHVVGRGRIGNGTVMNAGHYDIDDSTCTITTWTERNIGLANGWYFIMPNTSRDGSKGTAVALSHGVTIRCEGSKIFHCSTIFNKGARNNVYRTCVQSKK